MISEGVETRAGGVDSERSENRSYLLGLGRGFGGAVIFSIPTLMTMEMWWLGFYMDRLRLALAALLLFPLLVGLSYFVGMRANDLNLAGVLDAVTGYGIGIVASAVVLMAMGIVSTSMPAREIVGKVMLMALPASFGSMLGRSQLGGQADRRQEEKERKSGWHGEMFIMVAGALYLSLTVAPTAEVIVIPFMMTTWHVLVLLLLTILMMHAFVYALEFRGAPSHASRKPWWSLFIRYTIPGYVIALVVAGYLLWTFGRLQDASFYWWVVYCIVLAMPAGLGAAAGRLIL